MYRACIRICRSHIEIQVLLSICTSNLKASAPLAPKHFSSIARDYDSTSLWTTKRLNRDKKTRVEMSLSGKHCNVIALSVF